MTQNAKSTFYLALIECGCSNQPLNNASLCDAYNFLKVVLYCGIRGIQPTIPLISSLVNPLFDPGPVMVNFEENKNCRKQQHFCTIAHWAMQGRFSLILIDCARVHKWFNEESAVLVKPL